MTDAKVDWIATQLLGGESREGAHLNRTLHELQCRARHCIGLLRHGVIAPEPHEAEYLICGDGERTRNSFDSAELRPRRNSRFANGG